MNDNGLAYSVEVDVDNLLAEVDRLRSLVRRMREVTVESVETGQDGYYAMMMALTSEALSG